MTTGENDYTHLAILDFEANCLEDRVIEPQEILEVPVILYDVLTRQLEPDTIFHAYCCPLVAVTPFCTQLTGITQDMVDGADNFQHVLARLNHWVWQQGLQRDDGSYSVLFVTCGDWDLRTALPKQCRLSGKKVPGYLRQWCNVKQIYRKHTGRKARGMVEMLSELGLALEGRHHSGIDDTKNIARIVAWLHQHGATFRVTGKV